ncbi:MAG: hypothetical protein F4Y87_01080 [Synechococcus sp. SB0665_bin_28]|nr:hypothetical protein [Synechococcus sp. SB0665_bin_28]MYF20081.1 hypothetical protein [Synechococcus sp. SB0677_bin_5]
MLPCTGRSLRIRAISKVLLARLWQRGLHWVTSICRNRKNGLLPLLDRVLLRKRCIIETLFDVLSPAWAWSTPATAGPSMPWSIFSPVWPPTPWPNPRSTSATSPSLPPYPPSQPPPPEPLSSIGVTTRKRLQVAPSDGELRCQDQGVSVHCQPF